jgi:hypothetical protein
MIRIPAILALLGILQLGGLGVVSADCKDSLNSATYGKLQYYKPASTKPEHINLPCVTGIVIPPIYKMVCVRNLTTCKRVGEDPECKSSEPSCSDCEEGRACKKSHLYKLLPKDQAIREALIGEKYSGKQDNRGIEEKDLLPECDSSNTRDENNEKAESSNFKDDFEASEDEDNMVGLSSQRPKHCSCGRRWSDKCSTERETFCIEWATVTTCTTKFHCPILGPQICCEPVIEYPGTTLYVDQNNNPIVPTTPQPKDSDTSHD